MSATASSITNPHQPGPVITSHSLRDAAAHAKVERRLTVEHRTGSLARQPGRALAPGSGLRAVALIDEHQFTRDCIAVCIETLCRDIAVTTFATAADCVLAGAEQFELVICHARAGTAKATSLAALRQQLGMVPVLMASDAEDAGAMLDAFAAGVRGYIPTASTSLQVMVEVIHLLRAGGTFAPVAASLMQQAHAPPKPHMPPPDQFTPRQMAVLEHLKQGSANKIIAHELSMSEGTVKVHVRNIMRKLQATNRTQAVFRAYNLPGSTGTGRRMEASV